MRFIPAALVAAALLPHPASAERLVFSPEAFQIYGGMDGSDVAGPPRRRGPAHGGRRIVDFASDLEPGSILVRTGERRLYFILPQGQAIEYAVGVGREGFTWSGTNRITRKAEWPDWRPPPVMIARERARGHRIPAFMPGGPDNPLGARALYIGNTQFRIHGTAQPWSIGLAVSSGCIRLLNEEVIDLYNRVQVGARVVVE